MSSVYRIQLTELAQAFARAKASLSEVEAEARSEVDRLLSDGLSSPNDLMFTSFKVNGTGFIAYATDEDGVIEVDTYTEEELGESLTEGPFKGYKIVVPTPDSEDR